jgi:hypothetical protein
MHVSARLGKTEHLATLHERDAKLESTNAVCDERGKKKGESEKRKKKRKRR